MTEHSNGGDENYKLIDDVPEYVSTDVVTDIKTGIYNLFINLYRSQIPQYGTEGSMLNAIEFLEEIIYNFRNAIDNKEQ